MTDNTTIGPGQPLATLDTASNFVLWGIRLWVKGFREGHHYDFALFQYYESHGVGAVAWLIDALMQTLVASHRRAIQIHCPHCQQLSEDEKRLITVIARYQRLPASWFPLCQLLRPAAARSLQPILTDLAGTLADAGLQMTAAEAPQTDTCRVRVIKVFHVS